MAKLTDLEKKQLLADYHTNQFSQRALSKKYNISIGTVNKLTKEITPKNEHVHNAQVTLLRASSILSETEMNAIMNTAKDKVYNEALAINATQLNLIRMTEHLTVNKKLEKINIGDGIQKFEEVGLGSGDYKNIQDGIDKATITLGINQRHATNNIVNTNAQQNNDNNLKVEFVKTD